MQYRPVARDRAATFLGLFVVALLPTLAFGSGLILGDSDARLHLDPLQFIANLRYSWDPTSLLGFDGGSEQLYLTPYTWAYGVLAMMHVSPIIAQRIVMFAIYLACASAMYWCMRTLPPRIQHFPALLAAAVFTWNPYVAFNSQGSSVMLLSYAALPVLIALIYLGVSGELDIYVAAVAVAATVFFASGVNPPLLAIDALICALYIIVLVVTAPQSRRTAAKRVAAISALGLLITVAVNYYWIVPFFDYFRSVWIGGVLIEPQSMHNADTSFFNVLRGFGQWAIFQGDDRGPYYAWASPFAGGLFYVMACIVPGLAFLAPVHRRNQNATAALLLLSLAISVPLVVGDYSGPIGSAVTAQPYDFLFTHVPGFQIFRSVYKWVEGVEFGIAGLFALQAEALLRLAHRLGHRRGALLRAGTAAGAVGLLLFVFSPMLSGKFNRAEEPIPPWFHKIRALLPTGNASRVALLPSQYLETYVWGDPTYYIEQGLAPNHFVYGYLGSAPNEGADAWLKRAYRSARLGDVRAADIFRFLNVGDLLQRDDFRSEADFAFSGTIVHTNTSLSHDIATRILGGVPLRSEGALRTYRLRDALPLVYGVPQSVIARESLRLFAGNANPAFLARGGVAIDPDGLTMAQLQQAHSAGAAIDGASVRAVAEISLSGPRTGVTDAGTKATVRVPRAGLYHLAIENEAGVRARPLTRIRIDGRVLVSKARGSESWHDFGDVYLSRGAHVIQIRANPERRYFQLVPAVDWHRRVLALSRFGSKIGLNVFERRGKTADDPALDVATALRLPTRDRKPAAIVPHVGGTTAIDIPAFNGRGTVVTEKLLLPKRWYERPGTFRWTRGEPLAWTLLSSDATFWVFNPELHSTSGVVKLRVSAIGPHAEMGVFVNDRRIGNATLRGKAPAFGSAVEKFGDLVGYPAALAFRATLHPGLNVMRIEMRGGRRISAERLVGVGPGEKMNVYGGILGAPSYTVGGTAPTAQLVLSAPAIRRTGDGYDVSAGKGFHAVAIPISGQPLYADPRIVGSIVALSPHARAWIVTWTAPRNGAGVLRSRVAPIPADGILDESIAQELPNSFSDAATQLVGALLVVKGGRFAVGGLSLSHAMANAGYASRKRLTPLPSVCLTTMRRSPVSLNAVACRDTKPFVLVFGESYHPEWNATLHGMTLTHVEVNGFENGWIVPGLHPGEVIALSFLAQRRFDKACLISVVSAAFCIGVLFLRRRRIRACV